MIQMIGQSGNDNLKIGRLKIAWWVESLEVALV